MIYSPEDRERVAARFTDDFNGDVRRLLESIDALLALDAKGALAPHGIGGHARRLLNAAASRLEALSTPMTGGGERNQGVASRDHAPTTCAARADGHAGQQLGGTEQ